MEENKLQRYCVLPVCRYGWLGKAETFDFIDNRRARHTADMLIEESLMYIKLLLDDGVFMFASIKEIRCIQLITRH
jgi:hypothetical protein